MKNKEIVKQSILLMAGILIGFIVMLFSDKYNREFDSLLGVSNLVQVAFIKIDYASYMKYLMKRRMGVFLLSLLISFTNIADFIFCSIIMLFGIGTGSALGECVRLYGSKGLLYYSSFVMPHMLFYIPAYSKWLLLLKREIRQKRLIKKEQYMARLLTVILVTIIGLLTECYVNPYLVKIIVKKL